MKGISRRHRFIALLAVCISTGALSQEAKWTPYTPDSYGYFKEGDGDFKGPGIAEVHFSKYKCAIKMSLLANETLSVTRGTLSIDYIYSDKGYSAGYGLSCYTGERLKKIRAEFTAPDGSLGLSTSDLERRQEYPEANTSAVYFNGKTGKALVLPKTFEISSILCKILIFVCSVSTRHCAHSPPESIWMIRMTNPRKGVLNN